MMNFRGLRATVAAAVPVLLLVPAALAAQGFEGVIRQRVRVVMPQAIAGVAGKESTDPAEILDAVAAGIGAGTSEGVLQQDVTLTVKGTKMRIDGAVGAAGPGSYSVVDAARATMYTVIPAQQQILVATQADLTAMQQQLRQRAGQEAPATARPKMTSLGAKRVAGVAANGYRLTSPDGAANVWIDPLLGAALAPFNSMQAGTGMGATPIQEAVRALGVPIESQIVLKSPMFGGGWLFNAAEVTSISKQPVADTLFALPADYKQVSLGQMMGPGR
jgi:hypothetical protein